MFKNPKISNLIFLIALSNIAIHLLVYNNLEYHRDELLYFSLGLHPAFGYASVPPLTSWIAYVMQHTLGFTLFSVKLFPALLSGVMVLLSAKITRELGGKSYAQFLTGILMVIMPFGLRTFHLFQPVHIDLVLWTWGYYFIIRYLNTHQDKYIILFGVVSSLGMLNKYLIVLFLLALIVSFLISPKRNIFSNKNIYISIGIGILIFLPNLLWQCTHGLPLFRHMKELNAHQLIHVSRLDFLKDQLLMPFVGSFFTIPGLLFLIKNEKYRIIGTSVIIVILSLMLLQGKSYYSLGVFPVLVSAGVVVYEQYSHGIFRVLLPVLLVVVSIPLLPLGIPIFKEQKLVQYFKFLQDRCGLELGRKFEDGSIHSLPQDYADQLGWTELTEITNRAYTQIPDHLRTLIYCENYGQASAIAIIGKKYGLPEPASFSDNYRYWLPKHFDPDIENLIYINDVLGDDIKTLFLDIKIIGSISNINAREYGTTVYLCSHPKSSFNTLWQAALKREGQEQ